MFEGEMHVQVCYSRLEPCASKSDRLEVTAYYSPEVVLPP